MGISAFYPQLGCQFKFSLKGFQLWFQSTAILSNELSFGLMFLKGTEKRDAAILRPVDHRWRSWLSLYLRFTCPCSSELPYPTWGITAGMFYWPPDPGILRTCETKGNIWLATALYTTLLKYNQTGLRFWGGYSLTNIHLHRASWGCSHLCTAEAACGVSDLIRHFCSVRKRPATR